MQAHGFTLFDTPIGPCGVAWTDRGIAGVQLPERDPRTTRARLGRRFPTAAETLPPDPVATVIAAIAATLHGERRDLTAVALDMQDVPTFNQRVYAVARTIPSGATLTYGAIAQRIGEPDARMVGEAMGQNPFPIIVPCHRVLAAGGKVGGFSAAGGVTTKLRLLQIEGAQVGEAPTLFDALPLATRPRRR